MTTRTWVTPSGLRVKLAHLTHTSNRLGQPGLRDGGTRDGWWLITSHPDSGNVMSQTWLGLELDPHTERTLLDGLASVGAVPQITPRQQPEPCPLTARWPNHAPAVFKGCTCQQG
jgi:hypothetical protein